MGESMRWSLAVVLCAGALRAQETVRATDLQTELWEATFLDGMTVGYFRTTFAPHEVDGRKGTRSRQALQLMVRRFGQTVKLEMKTGTDETSDGKVVGIFMDQSAGQYVMSGNVKDGM